MRKPICAVMIVLFLIVCSAGLIQRQRPSARSYEHPAFVSLIQQAQCLLCGDNPDHLILKYLGQDNLGLINVNTFDIQVIEINRYDDVGQLIEQATGCLSTGGGILGESSCYARTDIDRGISHIDISLSGSTVNPELIGKRLCQACLDRFAGYYYGSDHPTEVAVINFSTREIHPLIETYTWFISGSYSVYCDFDTRNRIRLAVSYSPPRYSESIRE